MNRGAFIILAAIALLLCCNDRSAAQSTDVKKYEVAGQFSSLSIRNGFDTRTSPGFGGRFTYNVTDNLAVEAEGDFFPRNNSFGGFRTGGNGLEGLFGVKIGKRYKRFGFFGKARPGFISFSQGKTDLTLTGQTGPTAQLFDVHTSRLTHFAADIGGVVEFYPSRRIFTRFDAGDTIIRYGQTNVTTFTGTSSSTLTPVTFTAPSATHHNLQVSASVGFRF